MDNKKMIVGSISSIFLATILILTATTTCKEGWQITTDPMIKYCESRDIYRACEKITTNNTKCYNVRGVQGHSLLSSTTNGFRYINDIDESMYINIKAVNNVGNNLTLNSAIKKYFNFDGVKYKFQLNGTIPNTTAGNTFINNLNRIEIDLNSEFNIEDKRGLTLYKYTEPARKFSFQDIKTTNPTWNISITNDTSKHFVITISNFTKEIRSNYTTKMVNITLPGNANKQYVVNQTFYDSFYRKYMKGDYFDLDPTIEVYNQSGLIVWWQLNVSEIEQRDSSGNNINGTVSGGVFNSNCIFNGCYNITGTDYITTTQTGLLSYPDETFEAWIKPIDVSFAIIAISDYLAGSNADYLAIDAGKLRWYKQSVAINYVANTTLSNGVWYYIVFTWGSNGVKMYIDGNLDGTGSDTGTFAVGQTPVDIGNWDAAPLYSIGTIDSVRFYDRSLNLSEILQNWNGTLNTPPTIPTLQIPLNSSLITSPNVTFGYNSTDADGDTIYYSLFINGVLNGSRTGNITLNFSNGNYNWSVIAGDSGGNSSFAPNQTFTVNVSMTTSVYACHLLNPPSVYAFYPQNGNSKNVTVQGSNNCGYLFNITNTGLYSGTFYLSVNQTNTTMAQKCSITPRANYTYVNTTTPVYITTIGVGKTANVTCAVDYFNAPVGSNYLFKWRLNLTT